MADDLNPVDDKQAEKARKKAEREAAKAAKKAERERNKAKNAAKSGDGTVFDRLRAWLVDSYNGLFKIVIQPQLPTLRTLLLLTAAFVFGIIWAYVLIPVSFYGANPHQLNQNAQDLYVIQTAGAYSAGLWGADEVVRLLGRVDSPGEIVQRLIPQYEGRQIQVALQQIQDLANQAGDGTSSPSGGNILTSIFQFVLAIILFVLLVNIIALLWGLLIGGYWERLVRSFKPKTEADLEAQRVKQDIERRKRLEVEMKASAEREAAASDLGAPIMQRISPYVKGRPYDDSFAIEDANDMFLGECGATIAKTIGDSQDLTAIEIWLFDKEDFVRTLTKLFVSQHAYNDPMLRSELESRVDDPTTDFVVIAPGATVIIETGQILVQAKIVDLKPGQNPALPPNSHFEELTIQMQAWQKQGAGMGAPAAPVPAAAGGLPDLSSYEIGPPPQMPASQPTAPSSGGLPDLSSYEVGPPPPMPPGMTPPGQAPPRPAPYNPAPPQPEPPASGGVSPLRPPPMPAQRPPLPMDDDDDDDPFGGTGDFTPINQ